MPVYAEKNMRHVRTLLKYVKNAAISETCGSLHCFCLCALFSVSIGADSTGATGNFAPVLTQEPGQTLRFAPVPFMAVL